MSGLSLRAQLISDARDQVSIARQYRRWGETLDQGQLTQCGVTTGNTPRNEAARHLAYAGELRRSYYYCYASSQCGICDQWGHHDQECPN